MDHRNATCPTCSTVVPLPRSMAEDADPGGLIITCPKCRDQFDYPPGIRMDGWWDEPDYKACGTFALRGVFIITKLLQRDAGRLREVMVDLYRSDDTDRQDITQFEWQTILAFMGASEEEIKDVQMRMGRAWMT